MPWSRNRPRSPQYGSAHAKTRAAHMQQLRAAGTGQCAEIVCVERTRLITPTMALHLCHDRSTGCVLGLGHKRCNQHEAAVYARARQNTTQLTW